MEVMELSELATSSAATTIRRGKRGPNSGERGVELGADQLDGGDDHDRNASGDEAVFDRSGTRLVLQKCKHFGHVSFSLWLQAGWPETGITMQVLAAKYRCPVKGCFRGARKSEMKLIQIL
jgi:hypothetical protein